MLSFTLPYLTIDYSIPRHEKLFASVINYADIKVGDLYLIIDIYDAQDVALIKKLKEMRLKLGKDVGLISYNDTPVKEIPEGGITTIY